MPNSENGTIAGWNVNATHNFLCLPLNSFRRTWNFNSEKVVLSSRWKPCFHEASPVSGYLAALSVPLKERKDGTPFKWNTFFIDGHFTEISNFQFPKVAYHLLKVSGEKSGRKVNDTCLFGSFRQKISGSNGTHLIKLDKVVLFFRMESSKRKLVFHFFKAMFDKNFRPSRLFLGKWNQFVQM